MEVGGLFPKKGMEVCCSGALYPLGVMNTNDQQTSNTLMKTCASQFFIMESTSFTNLVYVNILVLSRNVVSLTLWEKSLESTIIQELRGAIRSKQ